MLHSSFVEGGGAEQVLLQQASELQRLGHDVHCFGAYISPKFSFRAQLLELPYHDYLPKLKFPIASHAFNLISASMFAGVVSKQFKEFDLLINHHQPGAWIASHAKAKFGIPYVSYMHHPLRFLYPRSGQTTGDWVDSFDKRIIATTKLSMRTLTAMDRTSVENADRIFTNSESTRAEVDQIYGLDATVCSPPLSTAFSAVGSAAKRPDIPEGEYVMSVARHMPRKRLDWAIEAFMIMLKFKPELRMIIVGDKNKVVTPLLISKLGSVARNRVIFREKVTTDDLAIMYRHASLVMHTTPKEEFGMAPLESIASGTPVVAWADKSGPSEYVKVGITGHLVVPYDIESFALTALAAVDDKELRKNCLIESPNIRHQYSVSEHVKQILSRSIESSKLAGVL